MADSKIELSAIKEVSEDPDLSPKDAKKERDVPSLIAHKLNKHSRTKPRPPPDPRADPRMAAIMLYNQRHPELLRSSSSVSTSQASSSQAQAQVVQLEKTTEEVLVTAPQPQDVPEVVTIKADEKKIVLELFALDIDIKAAIREELQQASIFVQSFQCMHLLRTYERKNPPKQQTLRIYLINPTAYVMSANKTYFGEKLEYLYRVIIPCEIEYRCCFFPNPIIHNPIDLYSNAEINIFLSDNTDLDFISISAVFDACKQKLLTQLAAINDTTETKSFGCRRS